MLEYKMWLAICDDEQNMLESIVAMIREMAAKIRKWESSLSIVFISSNREMALLGYEVSASRFLTKPVDPQKLREALLLCYEAGKSAQFILLPDQAVQIPYGLFLRADAAQVL